ncbi:MAG: aminotransferase class I/II-fold pyridoxal phosphate-dependent enzyme [Planctomycetes bacterium]|nr:aminotransferase class I/II-fold pyridoxal phosphate-dependent enzyme [Planctomycetota bacterium]
MSSTPAASSAAKNLNIRLDEPEIWTIPVSSRLLSLPPYLFGKLNALKQQLRRDKVDIIDLGMGNPTDPTPKVVVDKLCEAVQDPRNHRYSVAAGVDSLRREVAKHYAQKWGVELDPMREVIATIGSKEGFSHLCLALVGPGDLAIVPAPAFPVHIYAVTIASGHVISIPVLDQENFLRNLVNVCENVFPRPKLLILNYPHNPTTVTVELAFYEEIVQIARRFHLLVIQDFAYGETTFDGYRAPSFLQAAGAKEVGVEFSTMSKAFNMAGWRIGFCCGNAEIVRALGKIKSYYDYGIFQPVQIASIICLRTCDEFAEEQARIYQKRRDVFCGVLNRYGWTIDPPRATMFVWAPIPEPFRSMGSVPFSVKLMQEAQVAVAPGRAFGEPGEGYLRLALVENEHRLRQAARQMGRLTRS